MLINTGVLFIEIQDINNHIQTQDIIKHLVSQIYGCNSYKQLFYFHLILNLHTAGFQCFFILFFNEVLTPHYVHLTLNMAQGQYTKTRRETSSRQSYRQKMKERES